MVRPLIIFPDEVTDALFFVFRTRHECSQDTVCEQPVLQGDRAYGTHRH